MWLSGSEKILKPFTLYLCSMIKLLLLPSTALGTVSVTSLSPSGCQDFLALHAFRSLWELTFNAVRHQGGRQEGGRHHLRGQHQQGGQDRVRTLGRGRRCCVSNKKKKRKKPTCIRVMWLFGVVSGTRREPFRSGRVLLKIHFSGPDPLKDFGLGSHFLGTPGVSRSPVGPIGWKPRTSPEWASGLNPRRGQ